MVIVHLAVPGCGAEAGRIGPWGGCGADRVGDADGSALGRGGDQCDWLTCPGFVPYWSPGPEDPERPTSQTLDDLRDRLTALSKTEEAKCLFGVAEEDERDNDLGQEDA